MNEIIKVIEAIFQKKDIEDKSQIINFIKEKFPLLSNSQIDEIFITTINIYKKRLKTLSNYHHKL